jgi:hypothetical protein
LFETEFSQCFTSLFLAAGVNAHACASGDGGIAVVVAGVGVVRVRVGFFDGGLIGRGVILDFFNFRHLHARI